MTRTKILDHKHVDVYFTPETGLVENVIKASTADMNGEQFIQMHKDMMAAYVPLETQLRSELFDCTFFFHEMSLESQEWIEENPIKFANESPIQKVAFVVSTGLFEQLALEDLMNREVLKFEKKYFYDINAAYEWLLK
jgi:hypothetical protein